MLFELWQLDRFAPWLADPAVERVLHHERAQIRMLVAAEDVDQERMGLGVLPARAPPAEPARTERCPLAYPAVHYRTRPFTLP